MFGRQSAERDRRWRAGIAGATALLMVLLAELAGTPAQAEPVDMANQQYSKTTRDGWHLTLSIDNERVNSIPNLAAALNSREGFVTLSATATATVRKMLRNRNNTDAKHVIAASQKANAVFTTQAGAAPTRSSRSGRKFHVVMCT